MFVADGYLSTSGSKLSTNREFEKYILEFVHKTVAFHSRNPYNYLLGFLFIYTLTHYFVRFVLLITIFNVVMPVFSIMFDYCFDCHGD